MDLDRLAHRSRQNLASLGWTIRLSEDSYSIHLKAEHALTGSTLYSIPKTLGLAPEEVEQRLETFLNQPEFAAMRRAPVDSTNSAVIRELRRGISAYGWSQEMVDQMCHSLISAGCLVPFEAEWIMEMGPPFNGWH